MSSCAPRPSRPKTRRSYYQVALKFARRDAQLLLREPGTTTPANPEAHYMSSGPEIWQQTGGDFEVLCAGMGTGGTLSGTGKFLREKKPGIKIVGVDPVGSLYYDFVKQGRVTNVVLVYKVEGIGEDFFPSTMNLKILDDIVRVDDKGVLPHDARSSRASRAGFDRRARAARRSRAPVKYARARRWWSAARRGWETGPRASSRVPRRRRAQIPVEDLQRRLDARERLPRRLAGQSVPCASMMQGKRPIVTARPDAKLREVVEQMKSLGISQIPVVEKGRMRGIVAEVDLPSRVPRHGRQDASESPIAEVVEDDYATVTPNTKIELLQGVLADAKVAIVEEQDGIVGIVTKIDLIDFLAKHKGNRAVDATAARGRAELSPAARRPGDDDVVDALSWSRPYRSERSG